MNESNLIKEYRLTQYSHGAGCGCKISPKVLDQILHQSEKQAVFPNLLVGNEERDDAAVVDLGDGTAIISTTDFFMPIVDDAFDFGRIASVNAISDVYAMGGTPIMAIAILGWPINELPPELANRVIAGSRAACLEANIPLAGGHSIDSPEPIFGLAVSGRVKIEHLKKNGGAGKGDLLYLTKGLGVGILSTAQKKGKLLARHEGLAAKSMSQLNKIGEVFGQQPYIHAMTDVTGFGLMGHLSELCEASHLSAEVFFEKIPLLDVEAVNHYIKEGCLPGGTHRNFDSYGHKLAPMSDYEKAILCDPQTSGGLLVAISEEKQHDFEQLCEQHQLELQAIGQLIEQKDHLVTLRKNN